MLKKITCVLLAVAFAVFLSACAEKDIKTTHKEEIQTESTPTDVSPGEMIVD